MTLQNISQHELKVLVYFKVENQLFKARKEKKKKTPIWTESTNNLQVMIKIWMKFGSKQFSV